MTEGVSVAEDRVRNTCNLETAEEAEPERRMIGHDWSQIREIEIGRCLKPKRTSADYLETVLHDDECIVDAVRDDEDEEERQ
jgi:hypothetical protein